MTEPRPPRFAYFGHDLFASVVVFLVALPLCMGIAVASGAPVSAGLITGIVGGLIVAPLAGAPLQVSGPAAGLTVIVYDVIQRHGLPALGMVVLIGGVLQLLAGLFKLGQWFRAVSPAVIHGMLAGIGVLIFASQFHVMVDDNPRKGGWANLVTIPEAVRKGLPLPYLGTKESRQTRRTLLQEFGELHEEQVEILARVGDVASIHGSAAEHEAQSALLAPLAERQRELIQRFRATEQHVEAAHLNGTDKGVEAAMQQAEIALAAAHENLVDHDFEQLDSSQLQAADALQQILGRLKNHDWAAKLGMLTIGIIVIWQTLIPKRMRLVPGPLVAVVTATALATWLYLPVLYVEVPSRLTEGIHFPAMATLQDVSLTALFTSGLVIAAVASAETLLCATAVDQMHRGARTRYDRELCAQGVGNMLCGFLGSLPMTGVIVRSAANVQAGAKSRMSSFLHGVWLLIFVLAFGTWLRLIPYSVLAGVLVFTGYKLFNPKSVTQLWRYGKSEVAIYFATMLTIVVRDLLAGVILGITLSAIKLLYLFSHLKAHLEVSPDGRRAHLQLRGAATFIRLPLLAAQLEQVPPEAELHVDFQHLQYIDHACLDLLLNWASQHETTGGQLHIDWGSLHARFADQTPLTNRGKTDDPSKKVSAA